MFKKIQISAIALLLFIGVKSASAAVVFSDITSSHPNYEAIMYLQENGIVEGYSDNTFRPEKLVNRAEALKIILLGSNILVPEIAEQEIFPDVMHGSWYAKYVTKAKNLGIVSGDGDTGMFRPGDTVNLAEALKMLLETNDIQTEFPDENPHPDVPSDAWFAPYFGYAESISLLDQTSSQNVNPSLAINRGILAELMYRLAQKPQGYQEGVASFFGEAFHGKTTASGAIFDASAFTCANRTYPFGTKLKVTNLANNQSVVVEVNDRGPYTNDPNRIIDLSKAAFESIASLSSGLINVSIVPVTSSGSSNQPSNLTANLFDAIPESCQEKLGMGYYAKNSFENVTLDKELPNRIAESEILNISGSTTAVTNEVNVFISDESGKQYSFTGSNENGKFNIDVFFPAQGTYQLGIVPGQSGSSIIQEIQVIRNTCINSSLNSSLPVPSDLSIGIENGDTKISWNKGNFGLFKLVLSQGQKQKTFFISNKNEFIPNYSGMKDFKEGLMDVSLQGAEFSSQSILEPDSIEWSNPATTSFNAVTHYKYYINYENVEVVEAPSNITPNKKFKIIVKAKVDIRSKGAIILPNGSVTDVTLKNDLAEPVENKYGVDVYKASGDEITFSYTPTLSGVYFAEINNTGGLAALNIPLYSPNSYPIIPDISDLDNGKPVDLGSDFNALRNKMLELLNNDRKAYGKTNLVIDTKLNSLAQYRAEDMTANNYLGHYDKNGMSANDIRRNYAISQVVSENIAKETTLELAEYGLMRSALHRSNILSDEWTRAGIGISKHSDGSYIIVQILSSEPIDLNNIDSLRTKILNAINEERGINFTLQSNLNTLAQNWSEKMTSNDFFDFTAPDGTTLVNTIRDSGVVKSLGTYIVGNTSFDDGVTQITSNEQITKPNWLNLGLGISQDEFEIIKITTIYTE
ncbi:septal ring lytic transglycosylase RlpA family protein [Candidatus Peregrinibacteria bacterium]|nr:septal ring lytic transglycosylase RlpA family protein [Candidatus Peregrinibacteria bacterium]